MLAWFTRMITSDSWVPTSLTLTCSNLVGHFTSYRDFIRTVIGKQGVYSPQGQYRFWFLRWSHVKRHIGGSGAAGHDWYQTFCNRQSYDEFCNLTSVVLSWEFGCSFLSLSTYQSTGHYSSSWNNGGVYAKTVCYGRHLTVTGRLSIYSTSFEKSLHEAFHSYQWLWKSVPSTEVEGHGKVTLLNEQHGVIIHVNRTVWCWLRQHDVHRPNRLASFEYEKSGTDQILVSAGFKNSDHGS